LGANDLWFATSEFSAPEVVTPALQAREGGMDRAELIGRSTDAGKVWRVVAIPMYEMNTITLDFPNAVDGFAITGSNLFGDAGVPSQTGNVLFRTTDGGSAWTRVASVPVQGPVEFVTPLDGWALPLVPQGIGKLNIMHTINGGLTWQPVNPAPRGETPHFAAPPHFFNAADGVAAATTSRSGAATSSYVVYATSDGGVTWSARPIAHLDGYQPQLSPISPTTWVVATTTRIYRTTDGGTSWSSTASELPRSSLVEAVVFSSSSAGIAMISNPGQIFRTTNGGRTWEPVSAKALAQGKRSTVINDFPTSPSL